MITGLSPKAKRFVIMAIEARIAQLEHLNDLYKDEEEYPPYWDPNDIGLYMAILEDLKESP